MTEAEINHVYDYSDGCDARSVDTRRLIIEYRRLREGLLSIFANADDYSGPDLRAAVADALGTTVKKLEKQR